MNPRTFADACVWITNSPILAIDTETSGLHPHEFDYTLGISVANEVKAMYFPLRHPSDDNLSYDQARNLIDLLSERRKRILFHNAIFDWPFLRKEGWNYPMPWRDTWDTMVVAWLLDENEPKKLEEQIALHLGLAGVRSANVQKERQKRIKKIGWAKTTFEQMQDYATFDARHTFDLYRIQQEKISKDSELAVALVREHRFLGVCDEMIANGVRVDSDQARRKLIECDEGIVKLQNEYPGLNFDSQPQLSELLYGDDGWCMTPIAYTPKGKPSTDKDTLLRLLPYESRILDIFDYRKLRKARSTYYLPLCERVGRDGRIHPWYRPHGTKTGRLSCSDPNAQTLPNPDTLPGIRECFIPEDGFELWEYDLEQAELRAAADLSDDRILRQHLADGDVHAATAMAMFGHPNGSHRKVAKNLNFGALYGIGAAKFVKTAARKGDERMTEEQARSHLAAWRGLYSGVAKALHDAQKIAEQRGYIRLWPTGRRRRFDSFNPTKDAFNSAIQGGIGEYVKQLMMEIREPAEHLGIRVVMNVHDSLVCEIPKERHLVDKWSDFVKATAERINPFQIEMPIGVKQW